MSKKFKVVSHAERTQSDDFVIKLSKDTLLEDATMYLQEDYEEFGRTFRRTAKKKVKLADRDKGLKVSDFSMENLQRVGALDKLKYSQLETTGMVDVDRMNNIINTLEE